MGAKYGEGESSMMTWIKRFHVGFVPLQNMVFAETSRADLKHKEVHSALSADLQ